VEYDDAGIKVKGSLDQSILNKYEEYLVK